jgi:peptide/nickel transport system permease protein
MKLALYLLRRLAGGWITVLGVASLCFFILHALPGDPAETILGEAATEQDRVALRSTLRLDQPVTVQYREYILDLFVPSREMGRSFRRPAVTALSSIRRVWPHTALLALCAALIAWSLAIPMALIAASRPGTRTDATVGLASLLGLAIPSLFLGPLLITLFCVKLPLLPFPGPDATGASAVVLPAVSLGIGMAGILTRMARGSLRDVLREPYVLAARARGLSAINVLIRHALRSALVPVLTTGGAQLTALLGGAIVTEKIFDRPGIGTLLLEALSTRDLPIVLACVVVMAVTAVAIQLLVDLAYVAVDPRIRLG